MFAIIAVLPFLTIAMVVLIIKSHKNLKVIKNNKHFKLSLGIGALSTLLCILFGVLGDKYIDNFQSTNGGCPANYPYAVAIVITGLIGLAAFVTGSVLSFQSK